MQKTVFKFAAVLGVAALASAQAFAAVGDTLTYQFNTQATGGATPTVSQASLVLTETALGVNFVLAPAWGVTTGNFVDQIDFAYSGEALTFIDGAGPNGAFSTSFGSLDAGYSSSRNITIDFPTGGSRFDSDSATSAWSLNGPTITLADFSLAATTTSTKPASIFGVISMPGASPSNWVAGSAAPVAAIPEPETYALLAAGLGFMGLVARRRQRKAD